METSETQKGPENKNDGVNIYTWSDLCTQSNKNLGQMTKTDLEFIFISSGLADWKPW